MRSNVLLRSIIAGLLLPGCLAVDDGFYQGLAPGETDVPLSEECGDTSAVALADETRDIHIDTTQAVNNSTSTCSSSSTVGNDLFIAFDVTEGEYWHFHLATDNDFPTSANLNPSLYLLTDACDPRNCDFFSNRCTGTGDEHFAFVASETGRYYLGIDDVNTGGGHYLLQALRPTCGNGTKEHGESCDDGSHCEDGTACTTDDPSVCAGIGDEQCTPRSHDGCDRDCRQELSSSGGSEGDPNDNLVEANVLRTDLQNPFVVNGAVGGPSDCYPDVFAIFVEENQRINVTVLQSYSAGTMVEVPCTNLTSAPLSFVLTSSDPNDAVHRYVSSEDVDGCPSLSTGSLDAGEYFITLDADAGLATPAPYFLKFEVVGP
jgi:hypothetical protein